MAKYAIWNKKDMIITPSGEVFTAEQWKNRYPVAKLDHITIICSASEINGAFFSTLGQLVDMYTAQGCDFSACTTDQEKLNAIEEFEANPPAVEVDDTPMTAEELTATSLASIAASMEYQNMMTLDDVEEV